MRAFTYASHWWALCSWVGVCHLAAAPMNVVGITLVVNAMRAVTGWDTSLWELIKVGERAKALARAFNCREGFTAEGRPAAQAAARGLHQRPAEGRSG